MEEIAYKVEYELAMLERKAARARGQCSHEETLALQARIGSLETQLETASSHHSFVASQLKVVEDEVGAASLPIA